MCTALLLQGGEHGDKSSICRFTNTLILLLFARQLWGGEKHRLFSVSSPPSLFCICIWKTSCSQVFCCFLLLIPGLCLWDPAYSARMDSILFQSPLLPRPFGWKSLVPSLLTLPGVPRVLRAQEAVRDLRDNWLRHQHIPVAAGRAEAVLVLLLWGSGSGFLGGGEKDGDKPYSRVGQE